MNKTIFRFSALLSGVLFGMGMAVSGMIDPAKVIGFFRYFWQLGPKFGFCDGRRTRGIHAKLFFNHQAEKTIS